MNANGQWAMGALPHLDTTRPFRGWFYTVWLSLTWLLGRLSSQMGHGHGGQSFIARATGQRRVVLN